MKKLFLLTVTFLLCSLSYAQETVYFFEGFDDSTYNRWTLDRQTNWIMEPTNYVGVGAPEAVFAYLNAETAPESTKVKFEGTARMMSNWYSPKGDTNLYIAMNYLFIASVEKATDKGLGLAVRTSPNASWSTVFEQKNLKAMQVPGSALIKLAKEFQDQDSVQVCVFVTSATGSTDPLYMIYFDDIQFFSTKSTGAKITLNVPDVLIPTSNMITVQGNIINKGLVMDSCIINYQIDASPVISKTYRNLKLNPTKVKDFAFTAAPWANTVGSHTLKVWLSNINGVAPGFMVDGDTVLQNIYVPDTSVGVPGKLLIESFTSSTCGPCASFNASVMAPLLEEYNGKFTLVKYQMNWPGNGDPYYMADAGDRRDYYGVNSVPTLYSGGSIVNQSSTTYATLSKAIENAPKTKAFFEIKDIKAKISTTGFLTLSYTILPFVTTKANIQSIIMENQTTKNASSNGEKVFKHVTMKMFPNGLGKDVQFVVNEPQSFEYSVDMKTTFMEELHDLSTAIFIQDKGTKRIYQSIEAPVGRADTGSSAKAVAFRNLSYSPNLSIPILATLRNTGDNMTSGEVKFQADGGDVITTELTGLNVAWETEYDFQMPNWTGTVGAHTWKFWVSKVNGKVLSVISDTATLNFEIIASDIPFRPLVEEFTSSTCVPCKSLNDEVINPLYKTDLPNQFSLIKYPMNAPGTGDPYYSSDYLKRSNTYNATVSDVVLNGSLLKWNDASSASMSTQLKTDLQTAISQKSLFEIGAPSITIGALGSTDIEVEYVITPKISGQFLILNVLVEGETVKNNRSNGEVAFVNTAMKMFPATGAKTTFREGTPYTYMTKVPYKNLRIEEYSDLLLISMIQDITTLQVMQSAQNAVVNRTDNELVNSVEQIRIYPNPAVSTTEIQLNEKSTIAVYDMMGRVIFQKQNVEGIYSMDVSSFARGSYVVKVSTTSAVSTVKLNVIK